ncbi:MAG: OsmC family protein [Bacteroidota bacterium]|nr:OsmC family protein [Bacteroidota bacterium]MDX5429947.1 OsmC family protein [Bacteroidota bacterium]MDX5468720.1 OsmC family protein [Bacteroidota bacterium]
MSALTFSLQGESLSPAKFKAKLRDFEIIIDEPQNLGGTDEAPNPVEYLLASYAGCLNVVGHLIAQELNIQLNGLKIHISGDLNPDKLFGKNTSERAGFQGLRVKLIPDTDAEVEKLAEWLQIVESRCPVNDNLIRSTPIRVSVEKNFKEINQAFSLN